jgi:hypothetical protein
VLAEGRLVSAPKPSSPSDGPRFDDEDASAALLASTFRPREDWTSLRCPDCRQRFLTDEGVCWHLHDAHDTERFRDETKG